MGNVVLSPGQLPYAPVAGFPGQLARWDEGGTRNRIGTWSGSPTVDVWTVTVSTGTNAFAYTLTCTPSGGDTISVVFTSTNTTLADIATGLAAAWNADPKASGYGYATTSTADVIITGISGANAPLSFTVSSNSATAAKVSIAHTQSASVGGTLDVARFAIIDTTAITNPTPQVLPVSSLTTRAVTFTVTYGASGVYQLTLTVAGQAYDIAVAADTDTATTRAAIVSAINAKMPANTIIAASGSGGVFTCTAEVKGQWFDYSISSLSGVGSLVVTTDSPLLTDDITKVGIGVSLRTAALAGNTLGDSTLLYPGGVAIEFCMFGFVWVDTSTTPSAGDPVYVSTSTGALGDTAGSTACYLPGAKWTGRSASTGVYEVQLVGNAI